MTADAVELNLDSIVGPTHNYAGLAYGNLASTAHGGHESDPKSAALEGLAKMEALAALGIEQAVLPPHERPDVAALRALGFAGSDAEVIEHAGRTDATLLASCTSASAMWAANAATVSPSSDTSDGRTHFTPARLGRFFHRSLETSTTGRILRAIFADESLFAHHEPLPAAATLGDEGAANHMRLGRSHGDRSIEVFVYGAGTGVDSADAEIGTGNDRWARFAPRQTLAASRAVARLHGLGNDATAFVRQDPRAIDAGVFHNDVIAVANGNVLLFHEFAFAHRDAFFGELAKKLDAVCGVAPVLVEIQNDELTLDEAVRTYLFNSQLVSLPSGSMALVCPIECRDDVRSAAVIDRIIGEGEGGGGPNVVDQVCFVDVRESMRNGGGPACLRLRVALSGAELAAMHTGVRLDAGLLAKLRAWVKRHYRDRLAPRDLADPSLYRESCAALDSLTQLLELPSIYRFQQD